MNKTVWARLKAEKKERDRQRFRERERRSSGQGRLSQSANSQAQAQAQTSAQVEAQTQSLEKAKGEKIIYYIHGGEYWLLSDKKQPTDFLNRCILCRTSCDASPNYYRAKQSV